MKYLTYLGYMDNLSNGAEIFFLNFGTWNIMFSYFVPISLLVSLEMVKYI